MSAFSQTNRLLAFDSPLGTDALLVESFEGAEGISRLFDYEVELLARVDRTIDPKALIGKRATVAIQINSAGARRYFNGIVCAFEFRGGDKEMNVFRARLAPSLWLLTLNTNTRVFQETSVVDVLKKVLTQYSISPKDALQGSYSPLDYCTQYRETDFAFVSRLMEQHGIFYYFEHTAAGHTLVLADRSAQLPDCPVQSGFRYAPEPGDREGFYDFVISGFASRSALTTGKYTTWDYRFLAYQATHGNPPTAETKSSLGANAHELYDFSDSASAFFKKEDSGAKVPSLQSDLQSVLRDAGDAASLIVHGASNAIVLQSGHSFTLSGFPITNLNAKYIVTAVEHRALQQPSYRSESARVSEPYSNSFLAQPASLVYRAPLRTPKPRVHGLLTGKVVVPSGEESYMDKYGRVCVQFFWDRERKPNAVDNTLLRVAQSWAGKGWGTYFWPRVDDEVLIDFLEGDPDAPIVIGSLYNGVNMPKYDPAGQYTRAGILTRSSKRGAAANANELRFEDKKGEEQIYMIAERDFDLHVEHDWHTLVDNERHLKVAKDQFREIDGDSHLTVKGREIREIDGDADVTVKGAQHLQTGSDHHHSISGNRLDKVGQNAGVDAGMNLSIKAGMNYSLQAGMNHHSKAGLLYAVEAGETVHIKGGMNVVIEGGLGVCLSGPGGFISIDPSGVTIQGMLVRINSGGAPLQGPPATPDDPQAPTAPGAPTAPTWPQDKEK